MAVRGKMSKEDRAKQFMPFAALKGYEEALREKERVIVPRKELTEYSKDQLDYVIRVIKRNDMVTAIYFCEDSYRKITGLVTKVDLDAKWIKIVNEKILFENLYEIRIDETN